MANESQSSAIRWSVGSFAATPLSCWPLHDRFGLQALHQLADGFEAFNCDAAYRTIGLPA